MISFNLCDFTPYLIKLILFFLNSCPPHFLLVSKQSNIACHPFFEYQFLTLCKKGALTFISLHSQPNLKPNHLCVSDFVKIERCTALAAETFSEPQQTTNMEHFAKIESRELFSQNAPSQMFNRVLNTPPDNRCYFSS